MRHALALMMFCTLGCAPSGFGGGRGQVELCTDVGIVMAKGCEFPGEWSEFGDCTCGAPTNPNHRDGQKFCGGNGLWLACQCEEPFVAGEDWDCPDTASDELERSGGTGAEDG